MFFTYVNTRVPRRGCIDLLYSIHSLKHIYLKAISTTSNT